jgi:hypothetical protein
VFLHGEGGEHKKAIDRWQVALASICGKYTRVMPESWQQRCVERCDEDFIKGKIVCQALVEGLGAEYMSVHGWLANLKTLNVIYGHCLARYEFEMASHYKTVDDVVTIVAVMLSYNTLYFKFPKVDAEKRRAALKDLRKKIKTKLGKNVTIPSNISDRLQAGITGK